MTPDEDDAVNGDPDAPEDRPAPQPTVFQPPREGSAPPPSETARPPSAPPPTVVREPPQGPRTLVGEVLNHIYEVKRLIGRGGMGEVYEGVNVNADERVAIKVMLPQLAADPNVQAMFRKEARTLTRIQHPAIVNYRVLAQEPNLGLLYIVTEFVDGVVLGDVLRELRPGEADLASLLRRLAEGLAAAHELGAIHRDMSPDNVLLPEGRLDRAKIIDFGIAKDLDAKGTIVGDGFAGKLGYVAPEQFGDYGREVGPWTDVYSLGLVILSVACAGKLDMGATLVDAVDKRRAGCDITAIPPRLQPVLKRMLEPDPAHRLRSMPEVLAALDEAVGQRSFPPDRTVFAPAPTPEARTRVIDQPAAPPPKPPRSRLPVIIGGAVAGALAVFGLILFIGSRAPKPPEGDAAAAGKAAAPAASSQAAAARGKVEAMLTSVSCSWLDIVSVAEQGAGVSVSLAGVAGYPAQAQGAVAKAVEAAGLAVSDIDQRQVAPVSAGVCRPLDALRPFKAPTATQGARLSSAQREYEIMAQPDVPAPEARAVITLALRDPKLDFALVGIEPSGKMVEFIDSRAAFDAVRKDPRSFVTAMPNDTYRLEVRTTEVSGWTGIVLLTGKGPFEKPLFETPAARRSGDWEQQVAAKARERGWQSETVWYRVVDDIADAPTPAATAAPGAPPAAKARPRPAGRQPIPQKAAALPIARPAAPTRPPDPGEPDRPLY